MNTQNDIYIDITSVNRLLVGSTAPINNLDYT